MTKRFRMIAGPNGSGKSTLTALLRNDYAVNFYTLLNADNIFTEVSKSLSLLSPVPVNEVDLLAYAMASEYDENVKEHFSLTTVQWKWSFWRNIRRRMVCR